MSSDKHQPQLDRMESKIDRLDERLDRQELQLQRNTDQLAVHIKRNDNFEKALEPVLDHIRFLETARELLWLGAKIGGGVVGGLTALLGVLKALGKI